jgi:lipoate-protein ligase A
MESIHQIQTAINKIERVNKMKITEEEVQKCNSRMITAMKKRREKKERANNLMKMEIKNILMKTAKKYQEKLLKNI